MVCTHHALLAMTVSDVASVVCPTNRIACYSRIAAGLIAAGEKRKSRTGAACALIVETVSAVVPQRTHSAAVHGQAVQW